MHYLYLFTSSGVKHKFRISWGLTVTRRVQLVDQKLFTLQEHQRSSIILVGYCCPDKYRHIFKYVLWYPLHIPHTTIFCSSLPPNGFVAGLCYLDVHRETDNGERFEDKQKPHNPALFSFMNYHQGCNKSTTMDATSGTGNFHSSWAHEFTSVFSENYVVHVVELYLYVFSSVLLLQLRFQL